MKKSKFIIQFICWTVLIAVILLLMFWDRVHAEEYPSNSVIRTHSQVDIYVKEGNCAVIYRDGLDTTVVIWDYDFERQSYQFVDQLKWHYAGYSISIHFIERDHYRQGE